MSDMIKLFDYASNDKSCEYLRNIFGTMQGAVCNPQNVPDSSIAWLGTLFQTFNSTILAVAALLVLYVTVVGVVQTAHEGEFMGKKWNNIWIPIRMVFGIAFLIPTASGFSSLQIIMMWVISQGVGAADVLWTTALGYVGVVGSPYAQMQLPTVQPRDSINQLFMIAACDANARATTPDPGNMPNGTGSYYCAYKKDPAFCGSPLPSVSNAKCIGLTCTLSFGPTGQCGQLTFCNKNFLCAGPTSNSLMCVSCQQQTQALAQIVDTFNGVGAGFVKADTDYRDFYYRSFNQANNPSWSWIYSYCKDHGTRVEDCCIRSQDSQLAAQSCPPSSKGGGLPSPNQLVSGSNITDPQSASEVAVKELYLPYGIPAISGKADFLTVASNYYIDIMQKSVQSWLSAQGKNTTLPGKLEDAKNLGWIFAGTYYYTIAGMSEDHVQQAQPIFKAAAQIPTTTELSKYRNNYTAIQSLITAAQDASGAGAGNNYRGTRMESIGDTLGAVGESLNGALTSAMQGGLSFGSVNLGAGGDTEGEDPISYLIMVGNVLLSVAPTLFGILVPASFGFTVLGSVTPFGLGTGVYTGIGAGLSVMLAVLMPALYGLCGIMIGLGGLLGIYVPLIPYIVFTTGAIGWLISTVEAMVAGPLVALGIISPSGQHEIMGKAEPAIMLLFNVFLRPSLMIFGLVASVLLAKVVMSMINFAFWTTVREGVQPDGLIQIIIFFMAYVMVVVSALNKCFSAIYLVPQQVMSWIGGQGSQYGEAEAVGEMKGQVTGTTDSTRGAMSSGTNIAQSSGKKEGKARVAKKQDEQSRSMSGSSE